MYRTSVSAKGYFEGEFFIVFFAERCSIYKREMDVIDLFKNKTIQEVFDDLDVIENTSRRGPPP